MEVFPLAIPDGVGVGVPLGAFGELGLRNDRGVLVLTVPLVALPWVMGRLGDQVVRGPERRVTEDGAAVVVDLWVGLRRGEGVRVPVGAWGEVGVGVR